MQFGCGQGAPGELLGKSRRRTVALRVTYPQITALWCQDSGPGAAGSREPVVPADAAADDLVRVDAHQVPGLQLVQDCEQGSDTQLHPAAGEIPDPDDDPVTVLGLPGERGHDQAGSLCTSSHTLFIYCSHDYYKTSAGWC